MDDGSSVFYEAMQPHKEKTPVSPVSFGWNVGVGFEKQSDYRHGG